jgi:hypothetical protein
MFVGDCLQATWVSYELGRLVERLERKCAAIPLTFSSHVKHVEHDDDGGGGGGASASPLRQGLVLNGVVGFNDDLPGAICGNPWRQSHLAVPLIFRVLERHHTIATAGANGDGRAKQWRTEEGEKVRWQSEPIATNGQVQLVNVRLPHPHGNAGSEEQNAGRMLVLQVQMGPDSAKNGCAHAAWGEPMLCRL